MNKKLTAWIAGGLLTATVVVFGYNNTIGNAAEKVNDPKQGQTTMMQMGQQDMSKMMTNEELQKQCLEIMNNPEMQKMMQTMMNSPEMQQIMQQSQGMMPQNGIQKEPNSSSRQANVSPADHAAHHPTK